MDEGYPVSKIKCSVRRKAFVKAPTITATIIMNERLPNSIAIGLKLIVTFKRVCYRMLILPLRAELQTYLCNQQYYIRCFHLKSCSICEVKFY